VTIYVDSLQVVDPPKMGCRQWCHMLADSEVELHFFATKLGCRRDWFQPHKKYPHYDLTPTMRQRAVERGAEEVTRQDLIRIWRERAAMGEVRPLPKYGTLYPIDEFASYVDDKLIIDTSGFGHWATATEMWQTSFVKPSSFDRRKAPKGATHVVWFGR
jgi:hypothetical protein